MLGSMITKIRKDKHITKMELARRTGINIGHITHIEKGERTPSHKTLKLIASALDVPYQILSYLYDEENKEEYKRCNMISHLSYDYVLAVDDFSNFIKCPSSASNASIAIKVQDDSMAPLLEKDDYAFLELNIPLNNKDIGLFEYDNNFIIRRFIIRKDKLVLRAENKNYNDIDLNEDDDFKIIGKIIKNQN